MSSDASVSYTTSRLTSWSAVSFTISSRSLSRTAAAFGDDSGFRRFARESVGFVAGDEGAASIMPESRRSLTTARRNDDHCGSAGTVLEHRGNAGFGTRHVHRDPTGPARSRDERGDS